MLKTIIKRDGTTEPFDPKKVNMWSTWASEEIRDRVDWTTIVMKAVKSCGEEIKSQELQQLLIKECVRTKKWSYSLMAGRLYNAVVRKEMYGNKMPSVMNLQFSMMEKGYMKDLGYTVKEYLEIEKIIDHSLDMHMAYFQVKQIVKKYSLSDRVKKIEYETPQYVFMRMAMALAMDEKADKKLDLVREFYTYFSSCRINAPTPNYMNLGTSHNGYSSCCLYVVDDSASSLAIGDHIAYTMTVMSAGIGGLINTRSLGDPVRGGIIEHQGRRLPL